MSDAVVVTGASTGIGAAAAAALAGAGFTVFAGVRDAAAGAAIAGPGIRPVTLDVTDADQIAAAVEAVRASGLGLAGLVNNAGIFVGGPLECVPIAEMRRLFDVNVFGVMAVTQAFLPLLVPARGRLVFVGSISGRITAGFDGPYAASKYALRALSESLRIELAPAGIRVSLIEPGAIATPIWRKSLAGREAKLAALPASARERYGAALAAVYASAERSERRAAPVSLTSAAIVRALTAPHPPETELVGRDAELLSLVAALPTGLRNRLFFRPAKRREG